MSSTQDTQDREEWVGLTQGGGRERPSLKCLHRREGLQARTQTRKPNGTALALTISKRLGACYMRLGFPLLESGGDNGTYQWGCSWHTELAH